jgi:hypothetical protein
MAFCTLLEWEGGFPFDRYQQMTDRTANHQELPEGCLSRIVGRADGGGAAIIEVWRSSGDAQRFSEQNAHLLGGDARTTAGSRRRGRDPRQGHRMGGCLGSGCPGSRCWNPERWLTRPRRRSGAGPSSAPAVATSRRAILCL